MPKKNIAKKRTSKSYIRKRQKMLRPKAEFLHRVLDKISDCTPDDRPLYAHCVTSYAVQSDRYPDGIPIPYDTIRRVPQANAFRLEPVLVIHDYWRGHSREYRPIDSVMFEYLAIGSRMSAEEIMRTDVIDFNTMRLMNSSPKSRAYDENRNALPELTRRVINKLTDSRSRLMLGDMEDHYQDQFRSVVDAKQGAANGGSFDKKSWHRWRNNAACREGLLRFPMRYEGSGMFSYTPAWYTRGTGRLFMPGGCLLSASRDLKKAAFCNLPDFRNYDVRSCHVFIAMRLVEEAGLDARPLFDYLDKDDPKTFYGAAIGIPGEDAKQIVLALCNGAYLPKSTKNWRERHNSILTLLGKHGADESKMIDLLRTTQEVFGSIASCLRNWHRYLLDVYIPRRKVRGGRGFVLPNACGMFLRLWELRLVHPRFRFIDVAKVTAHLLQGLEQACVQSQIVLDDQCQVNTIEHDGFTTIKGQADLSLWASITTKHGLSGMLLQEKALG